MSLRAPQRGATRMYGYTVFIHVHRYRGYTGRERETWGIRQQVSGRRIAVGSSLEMKRSDSLRARGERLADISTKDQVSR